jgi:hypothetical protein
MSRMYLVHELAHAIIGELPDTTGHTFEWRRLYLLAYAHCLGGDLEDIQRHVESVVGEYRERGCTRRDRRGKHIRCRDCEVEVREEAEGHLTAIEDYPIVAALARGEDAAYRGMKVTLSRTHELVTLRAEILDIGLRGLKDKMDAVAHLSRPLQSIGELCNDRDLSSAIRRLELFDDSGLHQLAIIQGDGEEWNWILAPLS